MVAVSFLVLQESFNLAWKLDLFPFRLRSLVDATLYLGKCAFIVWLRGVSIFSLLISISEASFLYLKTIHNFLFFFCSLKTFCCSSTISLFFCLNVIFHLSYCFFPVQLLKSSDLGRHSLLYLKEIGHGWFGKVKHACFVLKTYT